LYYLIDYILLVDNNLLRPITQGREFIIAIAWKCIAMDVSDSLQVIELIGEIHNFSTEFQKNCHNIIKNNEDPTMLIFIGSIDFLQKY
jgi:hypothetical protein